MEEESIEIFLTEVTQFFPDIEEEALSYLKQNCIVDRVNNKCIIIPANKIQSNIIFLTKGLARGYYVDNKGDEINIRFINDRGWITHYTALISQNPSKYYFQTLEECHLIKLPYAVILNGYEQYPSLQKFGRLIAESVLKTQQNRIESFQFLDAEKRYEKFITNHPNLFNRISLSHLSSYLGIKRQSLSRIRKKIVSK